MGSRGWAGEKVGLFRKRLLSRPHLPEQRLRTVGSGPAQQAAEVVVRKCQSESLEPPTSNSNAKDFILVSELKNCVPDALMTVFIIF